MAHMHIQHNVNKDKRLIWGIRSGNYHGGRGILNPMLKQMFGDSLTCMMQDAWIIYQLLAHILTWWKQTEECFQDRDARWNFPDLHAIRICQGGSGVCQTHNCEISGKMWTWYWTLCMEGHQSNIIPSWRPIRPDAVIPVFNSWQIHHNILI